MGSGSSGFRESSSLVHVALLILDFRGKYEEMQVLLPKAKVFPALLLHESTKSPEATADLAVENIPSRV